MTGRGRIAVALLLVLAVVAVAAGWGLGLVAPRVTVRVPATSVDHATGREIVTISVRNDGPVGQRVVAVGLPEDRSVSVAAVPDPADDTVTAPFVPIDLGAGERATFRLTGTVDCRRAPDGTQVRLRIRTEVGLIRTVTAKVGTDAEFRGC